MTPALPAATTSPLARPPVAVGIGELVVVRDPQASLVAYGLGSCIGLTLWDPVTCVAGLAHFMLPAGPDADGLPAKYVQGGLERFLAAAVNLGAVLARVELKAAGGAAVLALAGPGTEIGRRNAEALMSGLAARGLALAAADLGGRDGRTIQLRAADGRLLVRTLHGTREL